MERKHRIGWSWRGRRTTWATCSEKRNGCPWKGVPRQKSGRTIFPTCWAFSNGDDSPSHFASRNVESPPPAMPRCLSMNLWFQEGGWENGPREHARPTGSTQRALLLLDRVLGPGPSRARTLKQAEAHGPRRWNTQMVLVILLLQTAPQPIAATSDDGADFFERRIRPVLADRCDQ